MIGICHLFEVQNCSSTALDMEEGKPDQPCFFTYQKSPYILHLLGLKANSMVPFSLKKNHNYFNFFPKYYYLKLKAKEAGQLQGTAVWHCIIAPIRISTINKLFYFSGH